MNKPDFIDRLDEFILVGVAVFAAEAARQRLRLAGEKYTRSHPEPPTGNPGATEAPLASS